MSNRPPSYRRQREQGRADRAYCRINGRKINLGVYGSLESKAKYADLLAEADSSSRPEAKIDFQSPPTVSQIIVAYLAHAERYYRTPDGSPGREYELIVDVCRIVRRQAGPLPASDFGPKRLKAVRLQMVTSGLSRKYINKQVDRIRRMFRWAAEEEMIAASVPQALSMVAGLRRGRTDAKETEPIRPVSAEVIAATVLELPQVVRDMVEVQLLTGMRPGELVIMMPQDIDRSGDVWLYSPSTHKTEYRGHHRTIAIGPKGQAVLLRYLARGADAYLFRPCDSEEKRRAERTASRKTPLSCGNTVGSNRKAEPMKSPGERYSRDSYRRAIHRACRRAGVELWSPHRLRHSAATEVRKQFGLDACQAVLGHRGAKVSEIYAELDFAKAAEVAKRIG